MSKYVVILALAILLVPGIVSAQLPIGCFQDGDPGLYWGFNGEVPGQAYYDAYAGEVIVYDICPQNYQTYDEACMEPDTMCVIASSAQGWRISSVPGQITLNAAYIWRFGSYWPTYFNVTVPCDAQICDWDTIITQMVYRRYYLGIPCDPACLDCAIMYEYGRPDYAADTLYVHVVEAPPALNIRQAAISYVDRGQASAYVPFQLCNEDPCAPDAQYGYLITNRGHIGAPIAQGGTTDLIAGGECKTIYGVADASAATQCAYDTLTIIAWTIVLPAFYDTCVQVVHVVEPQEVPLFTVPVVTILVLALILAAAVFMRRRAVSRA